MNLAYDHSSFLIDLLLWKQWLLCFRSENKGSLSAAVFRFLITGRSLTIRYCKNNDFIAPGAKTKEVAQQRISARIPRYHVLGLLTETAALV
jgi:hypothetical protein